MIYQRFVKGQYLALNINEDGTPNPGFLEETLRPKTFARSIYLEQDKKITNENLLKQHRWNVILGNNGNFAAYFAGSFKDIRLWKKARTDAQIFSFRFNQVETPLDDLAGNLKFMDGNPYIFNTADLGVSGLQFANIEPGMQLLPTDNKNTICATDTYFDYAIQKCSRYPYAGEVSIIYTVVNNVQHGHQMLVEYLYLSNMFLPGLAY